MEKPTSDEDGMYIDGVGVELVNFKGDCISQGEGAKVCGLRLNE